MRVDVNKVVYVTEAGARVSDTQKENKTEFVMFPSLYRGYSSSMDQIKTDNPLTPTMGERRKNEKDHDHDPQISRSRLHTSSILFARPGARERAAIMRREKSLARLVRERG